MKRLVLFVLMTLGVAFAQDTTTINPSTGSISVTTSGNVLNLGGGLPWNNTVTGAAGGYSGGYTPAYNPSTGNIIFGYNYQTVSQTVAINQALANAGTGIQLSGYHYSWDINNDLLNGGGNRGTLTGNVSLTGPSDNTLESYNYNYSQTNTGGNFQNFSGTQMFSNQYDLSQASKITVSFTGKDQNFWAGYYGPRVHVNEFNLLYSTNPCAQNPAYSPSCSGFSSLLTSANLVPNPNAVATPNNPVTNSFAISTALSNSGSGLSLYGINYGFTYNLPTTASSGLVSVGIDGGTTRGVGGTTYQLNGPSQGAQIASYQLLTPSAINTNTLGNFNFNASVQGTGSSIYNMNASLIVMPDACTTNPLSSTSCTGYAAAYAKQVAQNAVTSALSNNTSNTTVVSAAPPPPPPAAASAPPPPASSSNAVSDNNPVTTSATSGAPIGSVSIAANVVSAPAPPAAANPPPPASNPNSSNSGGSNTQNAQQNGPAQASGPAPAAGPVTASAGAPGGSSKESASGTSIGLSVVAKNQQQNQAVAMTAVANATAAAQQAGTQAQQTALSVASTAASNAVAASQTVIKSGPTLSSGTSGSSASNSNNSYGQGIAVGGTAIAANGPTTTTSQKQDQSGSSSSTTQTAITQIVTVSTQVTTSTTSTTVAMVNTNQIQSVATSLPGVINNQQNTQVVNIQQNVISNMVEQQNTTTNPLYSLLPPVQPTVQPYTAPTVSYEVAVSTPAPINYQPQQTTSQSSSVIALLPPAPVLDRFGPINQMLEAKVTIPTTNTTTETGPVVNKNAQNNEAAGKVDINKMAQTPAGYGTYLALALKDASFYAPKEVYKNQKNVDNVRAFRSLANDNRHREMVDLQYK